MRRSSSRVSDAGRPGRPSVAGSGSVSVGRSPHHLRRGLVDVGGDQRLARVGQRGVDAPPLQVHLGQRGLHEILAAVVVAGQQAGGVQQRRAVRLDERAEPCLVTHRCAVLLAWF